MRDNPYQPPPRGAAPTGGRVPTGWGDPYAVTPSDPLHDWPPRPRASWLSARSATGADWAVVWLSPGSGVLLLLARSLVATEDLGNVLSALIVFACASIAGVIAFVLFFVRLLAKPWPPWIGMFVAAGTGTAIWVGYGLVPLLASGGSVSVSAWAARP